MVPALGIVRKAGDKKEIKNEPDIGLNGINPPFSIDPPVRIGVSEDAFFLNIGQEHRDCSGGEGNRISWLLTAGRKDKLSRGAVIKASPHEQPEATIEIGSDELQRGADHGEPGIMVNQRLEWESLCSSEIRLKNYPMSPVPPMPWAPEDRDAFVLFVVVATGKVTGG
jgi:hypothetical protein